MAQIKNEYDGKWYTYNDSKITQVEPSAAQSEDAYILFYIRKDVQYKQLRDIFPSFATQFPGKPVELGEGFGYLQEGETKAKDIKVR